MHQRDVLHDAAHDLAALVEDGVAVPVRVQSSQLHRDPVVLAEPQRVHHQQPRLPSLIHHSSIIHPSSIHHLSMFNPSLMHH